MIKPGEIQAIANQRIVRDTQIEKDYIITWVLMGLSQNGYLKEALLFKGGTALKKAYYPDYRFSEDLDFTFIGSAFDKDEILKAFEEAFEWIYDESRIKCADGKYYSGCTSDLEDRLSRHNRGSVPATKGHRPVELFPAEPRRLQEGASQPQAAT